MKPRILLLAVPFIFFSCDAGRSAVKNEIYIQTPDPEPFDRFNARFHADSSFQVSRIAFPIGGQMRDGFEAVTWTAENWQLLKTPVQEKPESSEYQHLFKSTDTTVLEKFWIDNSGLRVERHFQLKAGKWYLTYYDDINL